MSESALSTSAAMLFERDDARVLEAFRRVYVPVSKNGIDS